MATSLCVVLVAFDAPGRRRFELIEALGSELGFQTVRIAQYYSSGMILEEVVRGICDAHLVIADLSDTNRNVYYELGIAHALGKRVFLVAEDPQQVPFELGNVTVHPLDHAVEGINRLRRELRAFIDKPGIASPIAIFTGGTAVAGQNVLSRRLGAFALDVAMLSATVTFVSIAVGTAPLFVLMVIPAVLIYFSVTSLVWGATLGQRLLGLEVIRLNRERPSIWQHAMRPVAAILSMFSLGIGFFWALRYPRHQAIQDRLTGTLVVRKNSAT